MHAGCSFRTQEIDSGPDATRIGVAGDPFAHDVCDRADSGPCRSRCPGEGSEMNMRRALATTSARSADSAGPRPALTFT